MRHFGPTNEQLLISRLAASRSIRRGGDRMSSRVIRRRPRCAPPLGPSFCEPITWQASVCIRPGGASSRLTPGKLLVVVVVLV